MKSKWPYALALFLFVLPWQTRFIVHRTVWSGGVWEYGIIGVYAVEFLLWAVALWYAWVRCGALRLAWRATRRTQLFLGVCAAWLVYHFLYTPFPPVQLLTLAHIIEACIVYALIRASRGRIRLLQWSLISGLCVQAALALAQFFTQRAFVSKWFGLAAHPAWEGGSAVIETAGGRWLRAYGALPHPNILGGYMAAGALVVVYILCAAPREKNIKSALGAGGMLGILVLLIIGLMVSFSRSAILAFVCGVIIMLWRFVQRALAHRERSGGAPRGHTAAMVCRMGVIVITCIVSAGIVAALVPDIFSVRVQAHARLEQQSITDRIASYETAYRVAHAHWFMGTGLGAYTAALHIMDATRAGWEYQPVHNAFVLAFLEMGLVMSVTVIWFAAPYIKRVWHADMAAFAFALCVIALFDHYLWSLESGLFLCAAVFALVKLQLSEKNK